MLTKVILQPKTCCINTVHIPIIYFSFFLSFYMLMYKIRTCILDIDLLILLNLTFEAAFYQRQFSVHATSALALIKYY